jgi:DNA-binding transcriptional MocR family regulator
MLIVILKLYNHFFVTEQRVVMDKEKQIEQLSASLKGLNIQEITIEMTALIRSGVLEIGTKLPPVRELAEALGMSPASISSVWQTLKKNHLIHGSGRNGVRVCADDPSPHPLRYENVCNLGEKTKSDFTFSAPDPQLLPDLAEALSYACHTNHVNSYQRELITPELRDTAKQEWPYLPEEMIATSGGFDALQATLTALIQPGTRVAVEDPTTSRLLDILEHIGAQAISVRCDENGPLVSSLQQALEYKLSGFIFQPRTHSVTGVVVSEQRFTELAPWLDSVPLIIEDDGIGPISPSPDRSFGQWYPDKVVHIRTYSKTLGPDLRLAVLSASKEYAQSIQAYRNFGASWTSRILQNAAAFLLKSDTCRRQIDHARSIYEQRRNWLATALQKRDIPYFGYEGFSLWIPVPSEQFALITAALHGYAVFPGSRFMNEEQSPHIRVSITWLNETDVEPLADAIQMCFDMT